MSIPVPLVNQPNRHQPSLGRGPIGDITPEIVQACNDWLRPLAARDGFEQSPNLGAGDIEALLNLGRVSSATFSGDIRPADDLRTMLLVDMANVTRVIRWGMAPQEDEPTPEIRFRLTARGRRMLQQCCKALWDKMLFGKPEHPTYGRHEMTLTDGSCANCMASPEMILDAIVSKDCLGRVPEKGTTLRGLGQGRIAVADGLGGYTMETLNV